MKVSTHVNMIFRFKKFDQSIYKFVMYKYIRGYVDHCQLFAFIVVTLPRTYSIQNTLNWLIAIFLNAEYKIHQFLNTSKSLCDTLLVTNYKFCSTLSTQFNIHWITIQHIPTLLPKNPTITLIHKQSTMSTLKQEQRIATTSVIFLIFIFPWLIRVWSYGITLYTMLSYVLFIHVYVCMVHDLFRTRIRYLCPKKDILSLTKNIAKFQSIDRVYHTKSLK